MGYFYPIRENTQYGVFVRSAPNATVVWADVFSHVAPVFKEYSPLCVQTKVQIVTPLKTGLPVASSWALGTLGDFA